MVSSTLDYRAANGDQGELLADVGKELQGHLNDLGKKRGEKGALRGKERVKRWDEVKVLRKEYRQREGKVVSTVVKGAQVGFPSTFKRFPSLSEKMRGRRERKKKGDYRRRSLKV